MKVAAIFLFFISPLCFSKNLVSGHYLRWDTDHTRRQIRPVYPIDENRIGKYKTYQITAEAGRPSKVCYFIFAKPSDRSDFGAHCVIFAYDDTGVTRYYTNVNNERVKNSDGVYQQRYVFDGQPYAKKRQHLDLSNKLMEDKLGVAEYHFKRDEQGRSYSEIRVDKLGKVVPEHNGFYEARFAFDKNDYATYRRGYGPDGKIKNGPHGYATAHFWFDENGNFVKEEFRNAEGTLVTGPNVDFARIEFRYIDEVGNWHELAYFDESGLPMKKSAAFAIAAYDKLYQRTTISYLDKDRKPAENRRGVSKYVYLYGEDGALVERKGYSLDNKLVAE